MKLVLYSGGQQQKNHAIHCAISQLITQKRKPKSFTYIPFCYDGSEVFFKRAIKRYSRFGFRKFRCLPVDVPVSKSIKKECLKSDVIYLAGGNTYYFLKHLRKSALLPELKKYSQKGGIVAGLSAGAIILTPHIGLAGYPPFDRDENHVKLKNLSGLRLVEFEFFPHYTQSPRLRKALENYSRHSKYPLIVSEDGGGIVIDGDRTTHYGRTYLFHKGQRIRLP